MKSKKEKKAANKRLKIRFLSPEASIYKESATIILRGKSLTSQDKKKAKLLEFLSRAPISFDKDDS